MQEERKPTDRRFTLMGVGGAGCNIVDSFIGSGMLHLVRVAANTDAESLACTNAPTALQLGRSGMGSGARVRKGRVAAMKSRHAIRQVLRATDILILVAGLGGGTGSGSTPVIAKIARKMGITCVAIVTWPLAFENRHRVARKGLRRLRRHCASTLVIDLNEVVARLGDDIDFAQFFAEVDDTVRSLVGCMSTSVAVPSLVNFDFGALQAWLKGAGALSYSIIRGAGEDPVQDILNALESEDTAPSRMLSGATRVLCTLESPPSLPMAAFRAISLAARGQPQPGTPVHCAGIEPPAPREGLQLTLIASRKKYHRKERRR